MYLNAFDTGLVVSAAVQTFSTGKAVAHVYYDARPRTYEDCVRFGTSRTFSSLSDLIEWYINSYGKVSFSAHC